MQKRKRKVCMIRYKCTQTLETTYTMHTDFRNYLYYNASKFQLRYSVKPILLLPLGATLHTQEVYLRRNLTQSEAETINSN